MNSVSSQQETKTQSITALLGAAEQHAGELLLRLAKLVDHLEPGPKPGTDDAGRAVSNGVLASGGRTVVQLERALSVVSQLERMLV